MIISRPSPFGAASQTPERIVVHAMAERINGMDASHFLESIGLSAHALVAPQGNIIRCREDTQGAYHAKGFNRNSLGIEFLVPGEHSYESFLAAIDRPWVNDVQLLAGARVIAEWIARHGITQIDGHCDIDPTRKKDPGQFPWDRLRAAL